jgi:hypothetical protein
VGVNDNIEVDEGDAAIPVYIKSEVFHHPFVTHYMDVTHWRH